MSEKPATRLPAKTDAIRMARILKIHCQQSAALESLAYYSEKVWKIHAKLDKLDGEMEAEMRS